MRKGQLAEVTRHKPSDQVFAPIALPADEILSGDEDSSVARLPATSSAGKAVELTLFHTPTMP
jgi:hypothetical protein